MENRRWNVLETKVWEEGSFVNDNRAFATNHSYYYVNNEKNTATVHATTMVIISSPPWAFSHKGLKFLKPSKGYLLDHRCTNPFFGRDSKTILVVRFIPVFHDVPLHIADRKRNAQQDFEARYTMFRIWFF